VLGAEEPLGVIVKGIHQLDAQLIWLDETVRLVQHPHRSAALGAAWPNVRH
jgi:hypothetical protein